ncbi:coat protein [Lake Sarah-associated circular virus-17]|uniref:coat protein n=1 Tax=Lake Sarah-associated circular virus-17 TaxID=1685743 RepID=UPI000776D6A2|nr:coat protein [Lake Sarah-associated circular virus-17]ALE29639.1 coat protein [Lake Sarah-associated circular virus-17]ALE29640.1 coat protein [Lake Sarah-associated circular virus-17]ALE29643.1 coat protein [Lake Sarah-associated circular virus-17]
MKRRYSSSNLSKPFTPPRKLARTTVSVRKPMLQRTMRMTMPRTELKQVDVVNPSGGATQAVFPLNSTPSIIPVNLITTGSSAWNRIGRKVNLHSCQIQGFFQVNLTTDHDSNVPSWARIMLVYDRQPNGATPNINDILLSQVNSATDSNVSTPFSATNMNNRDRFEIIRDKRFCLGSIPLANDGQYAVGGFENSFSVNMYVRLANRETCFKADSSPGVIGDIATGSLLFITFGNVISAENPFDFAGTVRVRYADV